MRTPRLLLSALAVLPLSALVSCGGDGGTGPSEPTPSSLIKVQGDGQVAEVGSRVSTDPTVQVNDQNGSPMSGVPVTFSVSAGGGSITSSSATTDGSGQAGTSWTLGTSASASQTLRATAGGISATFSASAEPGAPASLSKRSGDLQTAAPGRILPDPLVVRVEDRFGNGVPDVQVTFQASAGSLSPTQATTDGEGDARTTVTLPDTEQTVTVTATGPGLGAVEFQLTAAEAPLVITTSSLDRARETLEYGASLAAEGGSGTGFTWQVVEGQTPPGIDLRATGSLSGIPTGVGDFDFTVQVQDSEGETTSRGFTLTVCQEPLSLSVGQSLVVDAPPPSACGVFLPSGDAGDRYRVGVLWTAVKSAETSDTDVTLVMDSYGAASAPPPVSVQSFRSPSADFRIPLERIADDLRRLQVRERVHRRLLRETEAIARTLPPGPRLADRSGQAAVARAPARSPESRTFREAKQSCDTQVRGTIETTLIAENDHVAIYQDDDQRQESAIGPSTVQPMLDYYADYGKQVIDDYFGGLPDVDGNGKLFVVIAPFDDDITEDAAAFVLGIDTFSQERCAASNEAEVTYFSEDVVDALDDGQEATYQALGTLVHEAKHISSLFNRDQFGSFHPSWIEEGTAEIASEVSSRVAWAATGGPSRTSRISRQSFADGGGFDQENWGVVLRMARVVFTLSGQPNALTNDPADAHPNHSFYGSAWHFHRFLADGYFSDGGTAADFFREQNAATTESGTSFLESATGKSMEELAEEHTLAAMVNGMGQLAEAGPEHTFTGYDFTTATEIFCVPNPVGTYPWPVTTTGTRSQGNCSSGGFGEEDYELFTGFGNRSYQGSTGRGGLRVHDLRSGGTGQGVELNVDTTGTDLRLVVVRIR